VTKFRTALLAATVLATLPMIAPTTARAEAPVAGLYVAGGAGVNFLLNTHITGNAQFGGEGGNGSTNAKWRQPGFTGLGSVGWGFGNGLRAEVEGNYRNNAVTGASGRIGAEGSIGGNVNTYGVMVNAFYDFNNVVPWAVPYIGAGVGYAWRDGSLHACYYGGCGSLSGTSGNIAYQGIVGAAFPIAAVPGLSLTAEYRYFGVGTTTFNASRNYYAGSASQQSRLNASVQVSNTSSNDILLGVRYAFNAAPAAIAAAPAPVAPAGKSFLVFFDWDKSTLTDRARGIIREAAASAKATAHTKIEVNGYADTSGTPAYNKGLSMRRAQTVAAELVRNGVGKNEIAIKAFGDTVLLVPTGPGVREPQNRRVEIIIR